VLFAPLFLACCTKAHPAVRRELALRAQTALLTGAGFHQEQQRLETKVAAKHPQQLPFLGLKLIKPESSSWPGECFAATLPRVFDKNLMLIRK